MNSIDLPLPFRSLARLALLTAFLIVYGSLVPFEYRAATLAQAIDQFVHIQWLDIDVEGRADWVANLVLYTPLGFFVCGALSRRSLVLAMLVTAMLGAALATGVEFLQIWADPRTVSLNDIVAEVAGTLLGLCAWAVFGRRLVRTSQSVLEGGPEALHAAVILYLLAYCFITLFPFDFLVSSAELRARLANPDAVGWLPRDLFSLRGLLSIFLKGALMAPLGAVAGLVWRRGPGVAALAALLLSSLLEITHLFEYSEQTDALSIAAAVAGAVAGNIFARSPTMPEAAVTLWVRRTAFLAAPFYFALLPIVRGWKRGHASRDSIEHTIASTHWLPFYYHYFTSEGHALASVASISASFVPLGILAWAVRLRPGEPAGKAHSIIPVAIVAFFLALILEAGGLITAGNRPDPTNVLIAVVAAAFSQRVCEWLARVLSEFSAPTRDST